MLIPIFHQNLAGGSPPPSPPPSPFTLIASVSGAGTTGAIDTTGANLLAAVFSGDQSPGPGTVSDSKGNVWTALTVYQNSATQSVRLSYCVAPIVGSGHTFTADGEPYYTVSVLAFSGAATTSTFDAENGNGGSGSTTTRQPGNITTAAAGELIVVGCTADHSFTSVDSGFTLGPTTAGVAGVSYGGGIAYLVQTAAGAVNPTVTISSAFDLPVAQAAFKSSAGSLFTKTLTATTSMSAFGIRAPRIIRSGSSALVASLLRSTNSTRSATTSQVAALLKKANETKAATTAQVATIKKSDAKTLSAATTMLAAIARAITNARSLSAATSQVAVVSKRGSVIRSAASSLAASISRVTAYLRTLVASSSMAGSIVKSPSIVRSATSAMTATLAALKVLLRTVSASTAMLASKTLSASVVRSATTTMLAAISTSVTGGAQTFFKTLSATLTMSATIRRDVAISRAAQTSIVAALLRSVARTLAASTAVVAARTFTANITRKASSSTTASIQSMGVRLKTVSATFTPLASVVRSTSIIRSASTGLVATMTKALPPRVLSAAVSMQASVTKSFPRAFSAATTMLGNIIVSRTFTKTLTATTAWLATRFVFVSMTRTASVPLQASSNKRAAITRTASSLWHAFIAFLSSSDRPPIVCAHWTMTTRSATWSMLERSAAWSIAQRQATWTFKGCGNE